MRGRLAVGHAHSPADRDVVADQPARLDDGDETQILREYVGVVLRRYHEAGFELPRQIGGSVDGFNFGFRLVALELLTVQPDLVIRASRGSQVRTQVRCMLLDLLMHVRQIVERRRHDVAIDIAAGRECVHHLGVDVGDRRFQIRLDDAVELNGLTCRQADAAVCVPRRDAIEVQPLIRRADSRRNAGANHEAVRRLQTLPHTFAAEVTIVLLIDAVELRHRRVVLGDRAGDRINQTLGQSAPQVPALGLDTFDFGHQYTSRWYRPSRRSSLSRACASSALSLP